MDSTCTYVMKNDAKVIIGGYNKLPSNNYESVINTLVNVGPLAITIDASDWQFYESGVFDGCS